MTPYDDHGPSKYTPTELILGGDWACSENQSGTLAALALALAARGVPDEGRQFLEIARLCETDMVAATLEWLEATGPLRDRGGQPGPRQ